ncbi:formyltransferase family protein [Gallaecimonas kandeliae]|uniref:formyltransferase family protein n=1 Tax=Gallaecimonas kandeliae TaxID=3029055 RepID=UPI00264813BE|nr:formyltransferase family protein [Gallaecimonas kandeliae]WKE66729.1 formyltransferase family protein [Gallaecimonas kandeliae]
MPYDISLLCTDKTHPVLQELQQWAEQSTHHVQVYTDKKELPGGDVLFLVSCSQLINDLDRQRYRQCLTLHASALPEGRGWSPHIWQLLEGKSTLVVSLISAADPVDSGDIWLQEDLVFEGHELCDEINQSLFAAELKLMDRFLALWPTLKPQPQQGKGSYYRKRTPQDSRLDPKLSLASQFDLLRVADPVRYPAFFEWRGHRYRIYLEKET